MPETVINGRDGTADVEIDGVSYKCVLNYFSAQELVEMTNSDTFCNEGDSDQEPGRSQLRIDLRGFLTKGGPASGPLIPTPQDVPVLLQYSTNCTIELQANFDSARADRIANTNALLQATGLSKGLYTTTWAMGGT